MYYNCAKKKIINVKGMCIVYFNLFLITDKMQLGPAPVEAVRRGDLGMGYDVDFVYSEVNADVQTFWQTPI